MRVTLFQKRFAPLILDGTKFSTIRGKARCKPGDTLSLRYWKDKPYRSKQVIIGTAICRGVYRVIITRAVLWTFGLRTPPEIIAKHEGFRDWPDMRDWFEVNHGLPYEGEMILWDYAELREQKEHP